MTRLALALALALAACGDDGDLPGADAAAGAPDAPAGPCALGATRCAWLAAHNAVRCAVDPAAASMPKLAWDDDLECVAQQWANTCPTNHNPDRTAMYAACGGTGYVGENMAWGYGDVTAVVQAWAAEEADYTLATNSCSDVCGHYTQIVWADTLRLGCASPTVSCGGTWGDAIYVCNYAPGGNYSGQTPYDPGSGPNASCE